MSLEFSLARWELGLFDLARQWIQKYFTCSELTSHQFPALLSFFSYNPVSYFILRWVDAQNMIICKRAVVVSFVFVEVAIRILCQEKENHFNLTSESNQIRFGQKDSNIGKAVNLIYLSGEEHFMKKKIMIKYYLTRKKLLQTNVFKTWICLYVNKKPLDVIIECQMLQLVDVHWHYFYFSVHNNWIWCNDCHFCSWKLLLATRNYFYSRLDKNAFVKVNSV